MAVLEVYADVTCPFTHVGLHRLTEERDRRGRPDLHLRVRAWPLELVNGVPMDAHAVAEKAAALRESVAPDLFAGVREDAFPVTTLPALAFTEAAYRVGPEAGEQAALVVRDLVFEEGRDVGDPAVLAATAAALGVPEPTDADRDAVLADYEAGRAKGVQGSPTFFVHGHGFFCPTLDIHKVGDKLEVEFDRDAFDAFVAEVFAD
ncbi:MAG: DsbA family protein [Acidimicrobiia bacterium]